MQSKSLQTPPGVQLNVYQICTFAENHHLRTLRDSETKRPTRKDKKTDRAYKEDLNHPGTFVASLDWTLHNKQENSL